MYLFLGPFWNAECVSSVGLMQTITVKPQPPDKLNFQALVNNFMFTVSQAGFCQL